ncbi:fasciclin domain-containing protein [Vibrio gallicus]|uniref:fasciclin domain-containing protein n=1 Tax=Vibrio gallicus TaxID=190897 RepID=UPI0021C28C41|nr:fasciclin domain-containing protein [Vibrio gallicus]
MIIDTLKKNIRLQFLGLLSLAIFSFSANAGHHGMKKDIVDIAAGNPDFSTLVTAIKAAGLVDTLKSDGPFTVFAPTNEAFAKLPKGTLDKLLMPKNKDKLVAVLTHHVVASKVMAKDVVKLDSAKTVHGDMVMIKTSGGTVMIDNATVTSTDIKASNGVIHVIDTVLIPK